MPYVLRSPARKLIESGKIQLRSEHSGHLGSTYLVTEALEIMRAMHLHPEHLHPVKKALDLFSASFATPLEYAHLHDGVIVPDPRSGEYMNFQKRSISSIATEIRRILSGEEKVKRGVLLADDMGVGKTIQAIGVIDSLPEIERVLIVCPSIMVTKFAEKLNEWLSRRDMRIIPVSNATMTKRRQFEFLTAMNRGYITKFVMIMNYELVTRLQDAFKNINFDLIVLDEAHYVKNPSAQRTKVILGFFYKGKKFVPPKINYRSILMMTGTPGTAAVIDICNLANALAPQEFRRSETVQRYCGMQLGVVYTRYGQRVAYEEREMSKREKDELLTELANRLRMHIMIRRSKQDVLNELPEKMREIVVLPKSEQLIAQAELEKRLAKQAYQAIIAKDAEARKQFASRMAELAEVRRKTAMMKAEAIKDYVQDISDNGGQIVAFCYHRAVAEYVGKLYRCPVVHGELDHKARLQVIQQFRDAIITDPNQPHMIVLTMSSCGVGIDIPEAQVALFLEMDWLPSTIVQAEDRLYRIGQKKNVLCQYIVAADTIDERIARRVIDRASDLSKATGDAETSFSFDGVDQQSEVRTILQDFVNGEQAIL